MKYSIVYPDGGHHRKKESVHIVMKLEHVHGITIHARKILQGETSYQLIFFDKQGEEVGTRQYSEIRHGSACYLVMSLEVARDISFLMKLQDTQAVQPDRLLLVMQEVIKRCNVRAGNIAIDIPYTALIFQ